jgi:UDPglucose 6-dehydrogenase
MRADRTSRPGPIGVIGLWHLGSVTAACLAGAGSRVVAFDPDPAVVAELREGRPPVSEPGLAALLTGCADRLDFTCAPHALAGTRCAWVTFDTPVDDEDNADVEWVLERSVRALAELPANALVVVSSQLPAGSVAALRARCAARRGTEDLRFACVPENLRLGRALDSFRASDRIVAGVDSERDRDELSGLLAPFSSDVEWMRVESAEMTKHALNGFLATSVAFINEIAEICESVGADAQEVSRGLKSERRIGPGAYLSPGDAFAGGTLARDIGFLRGLASSRGLPAHVFAGVADGNGAHRHWTRRKLLELLGGGQADQVGAAGPVEAGGIDRAAGEGGPLTGLRVAIWGLTYKPGTDTLRRSSAIELCRWLVSVGASVRAHDPAVGALPPELAGDVELCSDPLQAADGADALVLCTPWPDYLAEQPLGEALSLLAHRHVIDPTGALQSAIAPHPHVRYVRVGAGARARPRARARAQSRPNTLRTKAASR